MVLGKEEEGESKLRKAGINMYCSNCGKEIKDTATFCPYCGKAVVGGSQGQENIEFSDVAKYAEQQAKKAVSNIQSTTQNFQDAYRQEQEARKVKDISELFVNPDEVQKAVIGSGYLANMLRTGSIGKGFGILTDRRFYFRGKCYYKAGKQFIKKEEERTVDLQDITSSGYIYTRHILLAVIAILGLFMLIPFIASLSYNDSAVGALVFGIPFDVALWLVYILYKRAIYEVSYAGGSIAIKASSYGIKEIKVFDKQLRLAKDEYLARTPDDLKIRQQ